MRRLATWALGMAWRKGVRGGSRAWLIVGGIALLARAASWGWTRKEDVVFSEELAPGESLRITNLKRS